MGALFTLAVFWARKSGSIPENPAGTVGNTPGNLYNGGLMCEDDGVVYFSNPYDNGALYSMDVNEGNMKRLAKYDTRSINSAGKYLYYYQATDGANAIAGFGGHMMGLYRCLKNGNRVKCLDKTPCNTISLHDNTIYYQHYTNAKKEGMTLYRMGTNKQDTRQLIPAIIDPSCIVDNYMYYVGDQGDLNLYRMDLNSEGVVQVREGKYWMPLVQNGYLYYLNVSDNYSLYREDIAAQEVEKLTDDRVDCYNVCGGRIFYQRNDSDDPALMRMNADGSDPEVVASGVYTAINATSRYVYFKRYGEDYSMFRTPIDGMINVSPFSAARDAVPKK